MATVCCLLAGVYYADAAVPSNQTPAQSVELFLDAVGSMEFPAKDPARQEVLLNQANAYLDVETMGSRALAGHWPSVGPEDRKAFLDLLWKLVENVAYPKNKNLIGKDKMIYGEASQTKEGYLVPITLKTEDEAPAASMSYHLRGEEGSWKIDDVILDDVSIIEDLKYQFDKIIAASEFSGLLEKMRERLAKAQEKNKHAKV